MRTLLFVLLSMAWVAPASAQDAYAEAFAQGMGHWADGNYADAVAHMSRAYALKPNPHALRMIVRAYDFMGHCGAAKAHMGMLREEFSDTSRVQLQRCESPSFLTLRCDSHSLPLLIDGVIATRCGAQIALPPGRHRVEAPAIGWAREVTLGVGETRALRVRPSPRKWASANRLEPGVLGRARRFTVYVTPDGRRQVWIPGEVQEEEARPRPRAVARPSVTRPKKFGPPVRRPVKFLPRSRRAP